MREQRHAARRAARTAVTSKFVVLTGLAGGSFGQLLLGIRVLRLDGQPLGLLRALLRTVLICLVIPPLVFKPDSGRGLHDIWTGSAAFRPQAA